MNKNYFTVVFTVIIASFLIISGVYAYRQMDRSKKTENKEKSGELIGGQTDERGCLVAAGYSWCEAKQKCLRTWEEPCTIEAGESDIEAIKQVLMSKYGKNTEAVQVGVDKFDGSFARGGVKFATDGEFGSGGMFLAYKADGSWKLAFDGNGDYSCQEMAVYGFPVDMISDCHEEEAVETSDNTQIANPVSVYCLEQGGVLEMITDNDGGQKGMCKFANGSECEEWSFFRGDCEKNN